MFAGCAIGVSSISSFEGHRAGAGGLEVLRSEISLPDFPGTVGRLIASRPDQSRRIRNRTPRTALAPSVPLDRFAGEGYKVDADGEEGNSPIVL